MEQVLGLPGSKGDFLCPIWQAIEARIEAGWDF
jgi:hypothetical protein